MRKMICKKEKTTQGHRIGKKSYIKKAQLQMIYWDQVYTLICGVKHIKACSKNNFDVLGASEEENRKSDQIENLSKWLIAVFTP